MISFVMNDNVEGRSILYVVIEENNLGRMKEGDPITLPTAEFGSVMKDVRYPANLGIVICYEPDKALLQALVKAGDLSTLVDHLTRNLAYDDADEMGAVSVLMTRKKAGHA